MRTDNGCCLLMGNDLSQPEIMQQWQCDPAHNDEKSTCKKTKEQYRADGGREVDEILQHIDHQECSQQQCACIDGATDKLVDVILAGKLIKFTQQQFIIISPLHTISNL